jgi:REP element-mobilizing transposase RayT
MVVNAIGRMIEEVWTANPGIFPAVSLDASIVMPNHHHGIIFIEPQPGAILTTSLGEVMKWFKTVTTVRYSHGVRQCSWPPYDRKLWHRNYYGHIVRSQRDLDRIRDYILCNPANWNTDRLYPVAE